MKRSKHSSRKSKKNKYGGGKPKGTTRKANTKLTTGNPTTKLTTRRTMSTARNTGGNPGRTKGTKRITESSAKKN